MSPEAVIVVSEPTREVVETPAPEIVVAEEQTQVVETEAEVTVSESAATVVIEPDSPPEVAVTETQVPSVIEVAAGAVGPQGPAGPAGGTYEHVQSEAFAVWTITHGLGFRPNVRVLDATGSTIEGDVAYVDANQLTITFSLPLTGTAYLS